MRPVYTYDPTPLKDFNPRTPRGVRPSSGAACEKADVFQSTHPSRGATQQTSGQSGAASISIHAPLAGCDRPQQEAARSPRNFNPRTPRGVRRAADPHPAVRGAISIHAPLAGCDAVPRRRIRPIHHFNPRTPRGVRQTRATQGTSSYIFQSTHPSRGATRPKGLLSVRAVISIHAPLAGCDIHQNRALLYGSKFQSTHPSRGATSMRRGRPRLGRDFNPRTPRGVRRGGPRERGADARISIHAPLAGCDDDQGPIDKRAGAISIHAPLAGCDRRRPQVPRRAAISIHAPLAGCDACISSLPLEAFYFNPRTPRGVRPQYIVQKNACLTKYRKRRSKSASLGSICAPLPTSLLLRKVRTSRIAHDCPMFAFDQI